jgi:YD repeat-containing protein
VSDRRAILWPRVALGLLAGLAAIFVEATAAYAQNNPVPTLSSIAPSTAAVGSGAFTLTATGTNFITSSVVRWNGSNRTTAFVSSTTLQAQILASDVAATGTAPVTVFNPTPGGGTSSAKTFTISATNPAPTLNSIAPTSAMAGGAAFTLTATSNSNNFAITSVVRWNGSSRTTTFVSHGQLQAQITAADIATAGTASVTVFTATPGGGTSAAKTFTINNPAPTATSMSPSTAAVGSGAFTLTVTGTNYLASSVVRWKGSNRTTTFVSTTQLQAQILASDITATGTAAVTVFNPTPGGGTSGSQTFTITSTNPVPTLSSISPTSVSAGGAAFTLTATGTNFAITSVVRWNGSNRTTTYVSATQLQAQITAADIATGGTASVTVFSPTPGGGTSSAQTFTINNAAPTLTSISPTNAVAGDAAFTLTAMGTNFVGSSVVRWNGSNRTTTYVSSTQLQAQVTAADIATAGTSPVTVFSPTPGGGTSGASTFTINNPAPTLSSISPSSAVAGSAAFTLTATGTNFNSSSVVRWNGADRTTTFVSSTQLQAQILEGDIASAGTAPVTVFNPTPGGGTSSAQTFTINNLVPALSSISPSIAVAGGAGFTLTATGTNFISSSIVQWNGSQRATTFGSSTQLTAQITTADIATAGTASVTVFTPAPGGGTSSPQTFTITAPNPSPTLSSLSPSTAVAGGAAFTLTVTGSNFVGSSVVRWNGTDRTTTFGSATQLQAAISASDIATQGTASVTVFTPAPGGGTSNSGAFTIYGAPVAGAVSYTYDRLGRLSAVIANDGNAAIYTYDAVGNLLSIRRQGPGAVSITDFSPGSGTVGSQVTIYGVGFSSTPGNNTVTFNGTPATVTAATATQINTTVPVGATTGMITVTTSGGSGTSTMPFTVQP